MSGVVALWTAYKKTSIYGGNSCQSPKFPSLPVYFGSGGGLENLRISGGFAHVNDKMYICALYIIILSCFAAFFPPPNHSNHV